jgi:aminoglycoside phosphotransferase (APT) family kinase protein
MAGALPSVDWIHRTRPLMNAREDQLQLSDEDKLRARIEALTGGRVVAMERQVRWRPAWFVKVERSDGMLDIHVRGDRKSDILPFPELRREADVLEVLEQHGIPVPHIYGMCDDPTAIIMEAVPGTRDVALAASADERRSVARQFIEAVAAMHRLPIEPFVARGIKRQSSAQEIALAGLEAYWPLYEKNKRGPEPLIEFAVRWLRAHVPAHRTRASFIQFDSGQFLFEGGRLNALYDFEFSMIGEALTDLATMRMRDSYEPLGEEFRELCRHYAAVTGQPIDVGVLRYQNALFSTVSCMQVAGRVAAPNPGDPHDTYLEWDLALKRVLVLILAECMGVELEKVPSGMARPGGNAALLKMLADAVEQIQVADDLQLARKSSAQKLVEYLQRSDDLGGWLERESRNEAREFLGPDAEGPDLDARMEDFVKAAGPEYDERLLRYFAAQVDRRLQVFGPTAIGRSAQHVYLPPIE